MKRKISPHHKKQSMKIAGADELDLPKSDTRNIWDPEFGWILKDGRPTLNTKAYWAKKRREPKD